LTLHSPKATMKGSMAVVVPKQLILLHFRRQPPLATGTYRPQQYQRPPSNMYAYIYYVHIYMYLIIMVAVMMVVVINHAILLCHIRLIVHTQVSGGSSCIPPPHLLVYHHLTPLVYFLYTTPSHTHRWQCNGYHQHCIDNILHQCDMLHHLSCGSITHWCHGIIIMMSSIMCLSVQVFRFYFKFPLIHR
jgi:hypothetical protein